MEVVIQGLTFHVEVTGQGFPLVLLHGFTGDTTTWVPFYEKWGKHSTLIVPDIIGHGKTESPLELDRYHIETAAHDLKELLDHLKVDQVDLVGYSMGGRLALTFSILFPERVRKLILESSSPGLLTEQERQQRRMKDEELANFIIEQGIPAFVDYWEEIPLFASMKQLPVSINASIKNQRLRNNPVGLANSLRGMGTGHQPSLWGRLEEVTGDQLLVTGTLDQKFCDIAKLMLTHMKHANWITFEGCGHAIHVEDQEKFGTIVSDFLNTY
jgi:2-succinyl-6-hydroxy-2,4-cyclohexadiene-1-carboxylate synthase